ncbi:MAG: acylphosphatase [Chloroflexi bacterium]|jgi:acylphosphatase|nr:acylphosphatase [Chloroflexota bacterium]
MSEEMARVHIRVRGRVQGVGFRAFVATEAQRMGLRGWVRNVGWDQVEAVAEGPRPLLERLVEQMRTGPLGARVEEQQVEWETWEGNFQGFEIRRSWG